MVEMLGVEPRSATAALWPYCPSKPFTSPYGAKYQIRTGAKTLEESYATITPISHIGSPGRTRTYNNAVNSRGLCH